MRSEQTVKSQEGELVTNERCFAAVCSCITGESTFSSSVGLVVLLEAASKKVFSYSFLWITGKHISVLFLVEKFVMRC